MAKCTFWYRLTWVVLEKVQRAVKWLCVCVFVLKERQREWKHEIIQSF